MNKDLSNLSTEQVQELIEKYYAGEPIRSILQEYDLDIRPSNLVYRFPPLQLPEYPCEYCGVASVTKYGSRRNKYEHKHDAHCPKCGHEIFWPRCRCKNCDIKRTNLRIRRKEQIIQCYSEPRQPISFETLSFKQKVYLGALCRGFLSEDLNTIKPYNDGQAHLAPTNEIRDEIYKDLIDVGIISVSALSDVEAFVQDDENFPNVYYTTQVVYDLNISADIDRADTIRRILRPDYYNEETMADEAKQLWMKIAVEECKEYLLNQLEKVRFSFSPGEKTQTVFETILQDFSVAQVYGIIWKAVADASKLYLEKRFTKMYATNYVIGACERYAERAKMNHWNLQNYRRLYDLPQSVLSEFFFYKVLGIGEAGFTMPPTSL